MRIYDTARRPDREAEAEDGDDQRGLVHKNHSAAEYDGTITDTIYVSGSSFSLSAWLGLDHVDQIAITMA